MKNIILIFLFVNSLFGNILNAHSQGCVAIRGTGGVCTMDHSFENQLKQHPWSINVSNRYFRSFRHYIGKTEQKQRLTQHSEVINNVNTFDLSIVHYFNNRWSLSLGLPFLANSRSQLSKYGRNDRFKTHSFGLGDARINLYRWIFKPTALSKGNIQLGLGIKLATGDYKYQDYFPVNSTNKELRPVDQSIQLGDGGTGFILEINEYYNFTPAAGLYGNMYYLFNPREQNGVPTYRSSPNEATMSVPDQYMFRGGFNYALEGKMKPFSFSLGGRLEGIPVKDIIGGSEGFRRPGYVFSVEPAINLSTPKGIFYLSIPIALIRNRTQSVPDKETSSQTGIYTQGDAAFADYLVNVGFSFKL